MEAIELPCVKLLPTACRPTCATPKSVGLDLYNPTNVLIPGHDKILIDTGIELKLKLKLTPFDIVHHSKGNPFQVCLTVNT